MNNEELIKQFYTAFAAGEAEKMVACYHSDVEFHDPAFGTLKGGEAGDMWRMLLSRAKGDLNIDFSELSAQDNVGSALWIATYFYGKARRKVVNRVQASFEFKDGLIHRHNDDFDIWKWSRMALGLPGMLLGWTPMIKAKIRKEARNSLEKWRSKK